MNILVTGGAGYIGSVVTVRLLEEGHSVTVLDDLSTGHRDAVPEGARFVQGRVQEAGAVLARTSFDAVIHLAAFSTVADSVAHPERYEENNSIGSFRLLDAMADAGVRRIVFSSTAAVYGEPAAVPVEEEAPEVPLNPYGASKLAVDRELARRARTSGLAAISFRYFNVAGAYGGYGERHDPETHLIPLALETARGRQAQLVVYGSDYATPDGTCIRDYVHVSDVAEAHLLALPTLTAGRHDIINLGNGSGFSVRQVIDVVTEVTGRPLPVAIGARRAGDPAVLVASSSRAHDRLGWSPRRPDLLTIVRDAWSFASRGDG